MILSALEIYHSLIIWAALCRRVSPPLGQIASNYNKYALTAPANNRHPIDSKTSLNVGEDQRIGPSELVPFQIGMHMWIIQLFRNSQRGMKFLFLRDRTEIYSLKYVTGGKLPFLLSKKFEDKIYPVNLYHVFKIFKYTVFSTIERMTAKKLWD